MGNSSAFGSFARKALVWAIVAVVAILLLKFVVGVVDGLRGCVMAFALLLLFVAYAVIWAVRKL